MPDQPLRHRVVVPFHGHVIGEGVNADSTERVGKGFVPSVVGVEPAADGQRAEFRFSMLSSQSALERAMNLSAEIDVRRGLFAGGRQSRVRRGGRYELDIDLHPRDSHGTLRPSATTSNRPTPQTG